MTEHVARVLKKGIIVLPKALRAEVGLKEGDLVVLRRAGKSIIIEPLEQKLVFITVDPKLADKILREIDEEERLLELEKTRHSLGAMAGK